MKPEKHLIVYSGGQDSTTCLVKSLNEGANCFALMFDYGQKHASELQSGQAILQDLDVSSSIVKIRLPDMRSALLGNGGCGDVKDKSPLDDSLPASFVPGRNAMFLSIAYGYAVAHGFDKVVTGVCQTDFSGYPDCRELFVKALEEALSEGYATTQCNPDIETPLMNLNKAQTFKLAYDCGELSTVLKSRSCYRGLGEMNPWGPGCNDCPSCSLRKKGWEAFLDAASEADEKAALEISASVTLS